LGRFPGTSDAPLLRRSVPALFRRSRTTTVLDIPAGKQNRGFGSLLPENRWVSDFAGRRTLTTKLGLTFSAADFKTCPRTGRFMFVEVNSGPMFAAFNASDGGRLNAATISCLTGDGY
jgi:hypothetical protein